MAYEVEFLPDAAQEFEPLDGSLKKVAAKQIDKPCGGTRAWGVLGEADGDRPHRVS